MATTTATTAVPGKYLTFALADEEYALPVLKVREIIKMMAITQVPKVPPHVKGVINLRGRVIPIVDLRLKFGLPAQDATERTCIIVVDAAINGGRSSLGFVVDGVNEVMNITGDEIEPTPDFGERANTAYIQGVAKRGSRVKMLLDLDRVLSSAVTMES
jgi:purine-binding chemotaxis protein CheW